MASAAESQATFCCQEVARPLTQPSRGQFSRWNPSPRNRRSSPGTMLLGFFGLKQAVSYPSAVRLLSMPGASWLSRYEVGG